MKIVKRGVKNLYSLLGKNKYLNKFRPVLNALDEVFFGTDKVNTVPHITDHLDVKRFMTMVIIALAPVVLASVYFWGLRVLAVIAVSYIFGGLTEVAFAIVRKKEVHEGFLVTGLIFPLILPPAVPLWMVAVGVVFGVIFGKEAFGGTGKNIFNPAIVGRIFLSVAFPRIMSVNWQAPFSGGWGGFLHYQNVDAVVSATPLVLFKNQDILTPWMDMLFGTSAGCIGETFRIGIIAGGLFLILTRIIDWRIPLTFLISAPLFSLIGNTFFHAHLAPPAFQLLSGGLLLGAFFMATDPVTCPFTKLGKWVAGILLGMLTVLIRGFSGYVEGAMFAILLVNVFTPLIDSVVLKLRYKTK